MVHSFLYDVSHNYSIYINILLLYNFNIKKIFRLKIIIKTTLGVIMNLEALNKEYDKLQLKYGVKKLDSIYNGGCVKNPDICFVFMNPTARNIAFNK